MKKMDHYSMNLTCCSSPYVSQFHRSRILTEQARCIHTQLMLKGILMRKQQYQRLLCVVRKSILEIMHRKCKISFQQPIPEQAQPFFLRSIVQLRIQVEKLLASSLGVQPQHLETVSTIIMRTSRKNRVKNTISNCGSKVFHQKRVAAYEQRSVIQSKISPKQLTCLYLRATIPSKQSRMTLVKIIMPEVCGQDGERQTAKQMRTNRKPVTCWALYIRIS